MLVAIGDNCIDRYLPPIALECVGGNAVNVAANLATRGSRSAYAGVVGDDAPGTRILNTLQAVGVNIDGVVRVTGPTGLTEIQVRGGDYDIVLENYGVSDRLEITEALCRHLSAHATRIHLTVTGRAAVLIRDLRALGLPISVDLGILRRPEDLDRFENLLPFVSEAFFSAGSGAEDALVETMLGKAARFGARTAIATRGERGCTALLGTERFALQSQIAPGEIVDPLGAGDAFIAGYLGTLADATPNGNPSVEPATVAHSLLTASTWAAQACRRIGGWPGSER